MVYQSLYSKMNYKHALRPRMISGLWSIQGTAPCIGRVRKRFPTKEKGKYNTPTKNVVSISIEEFEDIQINHTKIKHNTEIM